MCDMNDFAEDGGCDDIDEERYDFWDECYRRWREHIEGGENWYEMMETDRAGRAVSRHGNPWECVTRP